MLRFVWTMIVLGMVSPSLRAAAPQEARDALARAVDAMRGMSAHGGYAGIYDLGTGQRYGESTGQKASATQIWVQPPGTQTMGEAYLKAHRATGELRYLEAAKEVARALWWTQRRSGGWEHLNDISGFDITRPAPRPEKYCTFDDNNTQAATAFLIHLDELVDEAWLDETIRLALGHVVKAQFPNGAWPQWYPLRGKYHDYYTFNDGAINDCITLMLLAHRVYGREEYLGAAKRGGEFIIASQGPEPQPAWGQQYTHDMKLAAARAFEPVGYSSAESVGNLRTLMELAVYTGEERFLRPIPAAMDWFKRSEIRPGVWSRLYEIGTNRPIYGDRDGSVHYKIEEISLERQRGYGWQGDFGVSGTIVRYERLMNKGLAAEHAASKRPAKPRRAPAVDEAKVKKVIAAMDAQGRWVEDGRVTTGKFVGNAGVLSDYLAGLRGRE